MRRSPVRWLSGWLILALLFMQLVTAAYACPGLAVPNPRPAPMAAMPDCAVASSGQADDPASLLCRVHCQQGQLALDQSPAANLVAAPLLLAVLDWAASAPAKCATPLSLAPSSGVASGAPPPGALPIYLSLLVLRN